MHLTYPSTICGRSLRPTILVGLLICLSSSAMAHHPDHECRPVTPRVECIPPLGTSLPPSHRRCYNRPAYWMGKIAHCIAPSSQEAMSWHRAEHRGDYDCDRGRHVPIYRYAKPWEVLTVGPRPNPNAKRMEDDSRGGTPPLLDDQPDLVPQPLDDILKEREEQRLDSDMEMIDDDTMSLDAPRKDDGDATGKLDVDRDVEDDGDQPAKVKRMPSIDDVPTIVDADPAKLPKE